MAKNSGRSNEGFGRGGHGQEAPGGPEGGAALVEVKPAALAGGNVSHQAYDRWLASGGSKIEAWFEEHRA